MMTIPEEASVTREGAPLERMRPSVRPWGLQATGWKLFFRRKKWGERMAMLMMGARPVANTAPKIPMPQGKMNTQSSTTLERLPPIMAAMESWGAPSLRTKHSSTLFIKKAGENSKITRRYVWAMVNTFPAPPNSRTMSPANRSPTATKNAASTAARYSTWVKALLASRRLPWLCKMEYRVPPPMPIIRPLPWMKL